MTRSAIRGRGAAHGMLVQIHNAAPLIGGETFKRSELAVAFKVGAAATAYAGVADGAFANTSSNPSERQRARIIPLWPPFCAAAVAQFRKGELCSSRRHVRTSRLSLGPFPR